MPFDLASVRERLPGRRIDWFHSVSSTMTLAAQAARDHAPNGTVIGADGQVAGIGRHGHSWHSEAEAGLYVSTVLRLPIEASGLPVVMLALGIATQRAISDATGLAADLRWPNDVLIEENGLPKKCAGILAQLEARAVVAGIGINVNHIVFPTDIEATATSLRLAGKRDVSREDLLVGLAQEIDTCMKILTEDGPRAILELFAQSSSYVNGRRVQVERVEGPVEGVTCGLDESGFLLVRQDSGEVATILAGGVRPA
jgi:BirA family biotin operon repressor/biotin-[acetyl-CoA-carboxylase] ligase